MSEAFRSASVSSLKRLLNLFSKESLKQGWPKTSPLKTDMLLEIAGSRDMDAIGEFILEHIEGCKQYVHLFSYSAKLDELPQSVLMNYESVLQTASSQKREYLYIVPTVYVVYLIDPYDRIEVPYLWPIKIEFNPAYCAVRFVKLEKNLALEFGDRHLRTMPRSITEAKIVGDLEQFMNTYGGVQTLDFNRGIKQWVEDEVIDGADVRMKDSKSTLTRAMDLDFTMKKDLPDDDYDDFKKNPLQRCRFRVLDEDVGMDVFACNPTFGTLNFLRMTKPGTTRHVVEEIIQRN